MMLHLWKWNGENWAKLHSTKNEYGATAYMCRAWLDGVHVIAMESNNYPTTPGQAITDEDKAWARNRLKTLDL